MHLISPSQLPLPTLGPVLAATSDSVIINGRGFQVIRGVPTGSTTALFSKVEAQAAFWVMGLYIGNARSNNKHGDLMGHVAGFTGPSSSSSSSSSGSGSSSSSSSSSSSRGGDSAAGGSAMQQMAVKTAYGSTSNVQLPFHSDMADITALCCLQQAKLGEYCTNSREQACYEVPARGVLQCTCNMGFVHLARFFKLEPYISCSRKLLLVTLLLFCIA
jgi:hypothetical protein